MTVAQAWRQMLAADQALLAAAKKKDRMPTVRNREAWLAAAGECLKARAAFSEALDVWERAA